MTVNGPISYSRYSLRPSDRNSKAKLLAEENIKSISPLDCALGIDKLPFKMTMNMMLRVAYFAQNQISYQSAEDAVRNIYGLTINDDTIRLVTNHIGKQIFEEDCRKAEETYSLLQCGKLSFPKNKKGTIYIETDGAALNTRHKNDDGSTWRENKLGVVFSSDHIHYWKNKKGERQHRINRREYISYVGSVKEFSKHLFCCAVRNGYGKYKNAVILSDGAAWIRNMKEELFPDAQQILDYFHLSENVYDYAKALFNMKEEKYKPWAESICRELKAGEHQKVLKEIAAYKDKSLPAGTVNLYTYIVNNINNINYPEYESEGYFIGSGAIESGNKIVLQRRLKQAGMRWNTETAQYLLSLKSKSESGLWLRDVIEFIKRGQGNN